MSLSVPPVRAARPAPPVRVGYGRAEVERLLAGAGDLLAATGAPVCARAPWLTTWYEAFPAVRAVAVAAGADRVDGLACLAVSRRGPLATVTLAGAGPSDHGRLPARDPASAAALAAGIAGVLGRLRTPWRLRLAQLPEADPVAAELLRVLPHARPEDGQGCPRLDFAPDRTLAGHVSAGGRRAARQAAARVARAGLTAQVDRVAGPAQVRGLLPGLVAFHRDRDHRLGRRSDLDLPGRRAFYAAVVSRLAARGEVEVFTLRLDGRLAAYFLGFRDGDTFRSYDGRISSEWPSLSLGQLLRVAMIDALLADPGLAGIDWCRGELQHKMHAVSRVVPLAGLRAESSPLVTAAVDRATAARRSARDRLSPDLLRRLHRLHRGG